MLKLCPSKIEYFFLFNCTFNTEIGIITMINFGTLQLEPIE